MIHPTAIVDPLAIIHPSAEIGPYCVVGPKVTLRENVSLRSHVTIHGRTTLQEGATVSSFAVLGDCPQSSSYGGEDTALIIGPSTHIREHVTIHIGTEKGGGVTEVGRDCLIMVGCHIGHDCKIGNNVIMANNVVLGGHVLIQDDVVFGGMVAVHQFTRIGCGAMIAGFSALGSDVIPYGTAVGNRAGLEGLNVYRLRKKNFSSLEIHGLHDVFQFLFREDLGTPLRSKLEAVPEALLEFESVSQVKTFLEQSSGVRPICTPNRPKNTSSLTFSNL